jgi:hypothetical protein
MTGGILSQQWERTLIVNPNNTATSTTNVSLIAAANFIPLPLLSLYHHWLDHAGFRWIKAVAEGFRHPSGLATSGTETPGTTQVMTPRLVPTEIFYLTPGALPPKTVPSRLHFLLLEVCP